MTNGFLDVHILQKKSRDQYIRCLPMSVHVCVMRKEFIYDGVIQRPSYSGNEVCYIY